MIPLPEGQPLFFFKLGGLWVDGLSRGEESASPVLEQLTIVHTEVEELLESEYFSSSAAHGWAGTILVHQSTRRNQSISAGPSAVSFVLV